MKGIATLLSAQSLLSRISEVGCFFLLKKHPNLRGNFFYTSFNDIDEISKSQQQWKDETERCIFWMHFYLAELKLCTVVTIYGHDHEYNAK